jgi:hypothetical protein
MTFHRALNPHTLRRYSAYQTLYYYYYYYNHCACFPCCGICLIIIGAGRQLDSIQFNDLFTSFTLTCMHLSLWALMWNIVFTLSVRLSILFRMITLFGGGTWPSSQRGALAARRSQVRIPVVAVNQHFVLICCWLREVAVRERPLWLPFCCITRVTHFALSA